MFTSIYGRLPLKAILPFHVKPSDKTDSEVTDLQPWEPGPSKTSARLLIAGIVRAVGAIHALREKKAVLSR
jgi:hypothetical protein